MKQIFTLLLAVCAMTFALTSCKTVDKTPSIAGTEWTSSELGGMLLAFDQTTYKFTTPSDPTLGVDGTYVYVHPIVTMKDPTADVAITGTVDGDKMSIDYNGVVKVFTKK